MEGNVVSDSHLFSTSRQVNRTVREREREKKISQNSPPHLHYVCMCSFRSPHEKKGTHEGRFITRHVSPMCCCNRNRS